MSNITTVVNALRTQIPLLTGFDSKIELQNSIDLERNTRLDEEGWGIKIEESSISGDNIQGVDSEIRTLSFVLTKKSRSKESDVDSFTTDQLALMDDEETLRKYLLSYENINIDTNCILNIEYVGNSGIELLQDNNKRFIYTVTTVAVTMLMETT